MKIDVPFKDLEESSPDKIVKSLLKETSIEEDKAKIIAEQAFQELKKLESITPNLVREIVCTQLLKSGLRKSHKEYSRLGMPVYDIKNTILQYDKENANVNYNPQFMHKQFGDSISEQYTLLYLLPASASRAHLNGEIYIHDRAFFPTRPFCFSHDMRFFLKNGVKPDGIGIYAGVSGPAKSLQVAMQHAARVLLNAQTYFSGGQGFDSLNLYLAPYARGLNYYQVKQAVEAFVYTLDQIFIRDGETAFTSASLELNCPRYLKDVPVVLPGGRVTENENYENYIEEARTIARAFTEVMMNGDHNGKPFHFPKPEYKIRKDTLKDKEVEPLLLDVHKLVAKFGSPYFLNMAAPYMPDALQSQCCRYFLAPDQDFWEDIKEGTVRSGSIQVITINLPNIAYNAKDESQVFDIIDQRLDTAEKIFNVKRDVIKKILDNNAAPFLTMECNKKPYFKIKSSTNSVGFIGLNEMVKSLTGEELHESDSAWKLGLKIIKEMADKVKEKQEKTEQRWGMVQTPAEGCSYKLAEIDTKRYKDKAIVQGDTKSGTIYYTNSCQVNYSANLPLFNRIKIDSSFHPLVKGGVINHIFLGEKNPDPEALLNLTNKICKNTLTAYFAYTKDITSCNKCKQTFGNILEKCPSCGAVGDDLQWYSRVTGYYTPVKSWNKGKATEFINRKRYSVGDRQ
ncbi:anaerobic ribonucleoside-triphosphate reductase [Candidatus Woesearchaeota archaeon]|nr:anaerobic ribonucleoside-triphosphate reductase [Candidatus Woesearchaeota archaeon]